MASCQRPSADNTLWLLPQQMVFIQKMKGMNDVPVLGQDFNTWFPLTITVYCGMLFFNLWEKCASRLFNSSRFRFDTVRRGGVAQ